MCYFLDKISFPSQTVNLAYSMLYIFWKLLFQWLILAINKPFLSIPRDLRFLLTQWDAYVNSILHCVFGDVYTHFLFWASFFLEYFFENPAQKRINLAFLSTFLSKFIPFEQFIPFLSTFLSTFLSNIQQKYFFEHFFEYSKKYSKCWVLFWVLFWELFWGFFWDFHYDKTYLVSYILN